MERVSEPVVSPDGAWVAYSVRTTDMPANRGRTSIWLDATDGSAHKRLTSDAGNGNSPAWAANGQSVYFLSSRSGSSQVWRIAIAGGEAEQVTKLPTDVGGFIVFPDSQRLLLAMDVWPDAKSLEESAKRDEVEAKKDKSAPLAFDQLMVRHWDTWEDGKFSHLFTWTPGTEAVVDLTPGLTTDTPDKPFGGMEEISLSPDGKTVAYVARVGGRAEAWTTNTDVYLASTDGRGKTVDLTVKNLAYDFQPTFSPDGKTIAVLSMARPGFEADRQTITLYDVASNSARILTGDWDRSASSIAWSGNKHLITTTDDIGNHSICSVDVATGKVTTLINKGMNDAPRVAGERIVYSHDGLTMPAELFTMKYDGSDVRQLTHFNDARVKAITWGAYEQFSFTGAHGDTVYGYVIKPAGYVAGQKYPVAFLIHGGPQGTFDDHFHYRWNPEVFAGHGYATVFIDFHGSTGYGQKFTDAIRDDWGGAPYEDLMTGLDAAIGKYSWLDKSRMAALGASYGGFMINWINGHTDRFRALVVHDGNIDERMAYFDTEELWFPEWEHGGTPWENPAGYSKHDPIDFIKNWKTPTLVVHGGHDYRVVDTQGMGAFTALQRLGVPSRFLYFPEENHWVLKPQNSKRWHDEVFAWIDKYTAAGAARK